jgi:hypothetical protein
LNLRRLNRARPLWSKLRHRLMCSPGPYLIPRPGWPGTAPRRALYPRAGRALIVPQGFARAASRYISARGYEKKFLASRTVDFGLISATARPASLGPVSCRRPIRPMMRSGRVDPNQRGGRSPSASQPTASVLMGSTTTEIFSVRRHVAHSKVRSSNPRSPGDTRASAILCLQVGHIGLSLNEVPIHVCAHARL